MIRSLRARLLLGTVGATLVFLVAVGLALYGLVSSALHSEFDARLGSKARVLSIMVVDMAVEGEGYKLVYERSHFPEYERQQDAEYFQLWRSTGQVLTRGPSLGRADLARIAGTVDAPAFADMTLPDGRPGRAAGIRFIPRREDGEKIDADARKEMVLVVAQAIEPVEARLNRFRWLLGGVFTAAMLAVAATLFGVVAALLRPLEHLANRIARLDADDLSARFAAAYLPSELRPVARRLDDLLRRLEATFAREKAFSADVAHELRTPLSGLRTTLEVMLSKPREPAQYREALNDCLAIANRLQSLVDNLLSLAQLESGRVSLTKEPLQLDYLLREAWKPFAALAAQRQVEVVWRLPGPVFVECDPVKLRIVFSNLFDNAVSYVPDHGTVTISTDGADAEISVGVANTGSTLASEQVAQVFDRFWRGDRSRAIGLHCGLGLSLCQRIITLLGGTIAATSSVGGTFAVAVTLPRGVLPEQEESETLAS